MNILYITLDPLMSSSSASERNNSIIHGLYELDFFIDIITVGEYSKIQTNKIRAFSLNRSDAYTKLSKHRIIKKIVKKVFYTFSLFDNTISLIRSKLPINYKDYYDYIISSSDPKTSHLFTKNIINKNRLKYGKWIQYWGDPLLGDISNKSIWPRFLVKLIERKIYNKSDSIVFVSPFTLISQQKNHPSFRNRFCFVPIPFSDKEDLAFVNNTTIHKKCGYFGSYYSTIRNLNPTYEAFSSSKTMSLKIAGSSDILLKTTSNIQVLGNIPKNELNKLECETDVFICVLNKKGTQLPGKLYHYAGTEKPIIVVIDGDNKEDTKKYLESFNRFILCENTTEEILSALNNDQINKKYEATKCLERKNITKMILESKCYIY